MFDFHIHSSVSFALRLIMLNLWDFVGLCIGALRVTIVTGLSQGQLRAVCSNLLNKNLISRHN